MLNYQPIQELKLIMDFGKLVTQYGIRPHKAHLMGIWSEGKKKKKKESNLRMVTRSDTLTDMLWSQIEKMEWQSQSDFKREKPHIYLTSISKQEVTNSTCQVFNKILMSTNKGEFFKCLYNIKFIITHLFKFWIDWQFNNLVLYILDRTNDLIYDFIHGEGIKFCFSFLII